MSTLHLPNRDRYKPAFRLSPLVLPWLMGVALAIGILAWLLDLLFANGFFWVIITPCLAALLLLGLLTLTVQQGRIRHPWIAGTLGGLAGALLYIGHFQAGFLRDMEDLTGSRPPFYQVEQLPAYIRLRILTSVVHDSHESAERARTKPPSPTMNWIVFAGELGLCVFLVGGAAFRRARRPYGETSDAWLERTLLTLPVGSETALISALDQGDLQALSAVLVRRDQGYPRIEVAIDHPSSRTITADQHEAWLSCKLVQAPAQGVTLDPFTDSKGTLILDVIRLEPVELTAILGSSAATALPPDQSIHPIVPVTVPGTTAAATATAASNADVGGSGPTRIPRLLQTIPPEHRVDALGRRKSILVAISFLPLLGLAGGPFLLALGLGHLEAASKAGQPADLLGIAACAAGGLLLAGSLIEALGSIIAPAYRLLRHWCVAAIAGRADAVVDPQASDAWFVEEVPRGNWQRMMLETATEVGFLRVDPRTGLRYEGDAQRWICPASAITALDLVQAKGPSEQAPVLIYLVLRILDADGTEREVSLRERGDMGMFRTGKRRRRMQALFAAVSALVATAGPASTTDPTSMAQPSPAGLGWGTWT